MLIADQQDKDLGILKFGNPYNFTYTLTNTSDDVINIDSLSVGCSSCTTVSIDRQIIGSKEDSILRATFIPGSTGINLKNISVGYSINQIPSN